MASNQPLNLLDLPVDILALILRPLLVLPGRRPIGLCPCAHHVPPGALPVSPLTVLLIHPAVHAIACPLLYEANAFVLDLTGPHTNHVRHIVRGLGKPGGSSSRSPPQPSPSPSPPRLLASPGALRRIASLEVRIDKFRGWILDDAVPLLGDMVVRGALVSLCVTVHGAVHRTRHEITGRPCESRAPPSDLVLSARPLLVLLADPYLRASRLRVDADHGPAWCRFHPGHGCARVLDPAGAVGDVVERGTAPEAYRLVEIDWRLIVHEMDPDGRELVPAWSEGQVTGHHALLPRSQPR